MQVDAVTSLSGNRKRRVQHGDASDENDSQQSGFVADSHQLHVSPKRLRNSKGDAVTRQTLRYNAHALLNQLAFSRLYVTANFQNFKPARSPVVICFLSERVIFYRALW